MIKITEAKYEELCDEDGGFCTYCECVTYGVEPDAREYVCDNCGAAKVYGIEELLIMGEVLIVAEGAEDEDD